MAFSSWATLLAGCEKWPGNGNQKKLQDNPVEITTGTPVEITDIQEISFRESGSAVPLVSNRDTNPGGDGNTCPARASISG